jgi:HlyD family secretion protein
MYRFAEITRGNVQAKVSASGKFDAVDTAQVGTQVSGQIAEIHTDFNERVKKERDNPHLAPLGLGRSLFSPKGTQKLRRAAVSVLPCDA